MARGASKKNQYWKLRKNHGRERKFKTPEALLNAAYGYFEWCTDNPLYEVYYHGATKCLLPKMRPFSLIGLCLHLNISRRYFYDLKKANPYRGEMWDNETFYGVVDRIEKIIYVQQFSGVVAGIFNPRIVGPSIWAYQKRRLAEEKKATNKNAPEACKIIFLKSYSEYLK